MELKDAHKQAEEHSIDIPYSLYVIEYNKPPQKNGRTYGVTSKPSRSELVALKVIVVAEYINGNCIGQLEVEQ